MRVVNPGVSRGQEEEGEEKMKLLTIKEVAQLLGVSPVTVHRYKREKGLPYIKIGNTLRFDWEDVRRWVEGHKRNTTS